MKRIIKQLFILFTLVTALQSMQGDQLTGAPVISPLDNEYSEAKDCQEAICSQRKLGMYIYFGTLVGLGILMVIMISTESRQLPTEGISSNLAEILPTNESMIQVDSDITKGLTKTFVSVMDDGTVCEAYRGVSATGVLTDVAAAKGPNINMIHVTKEFISKNANSEALKGAVEEIFNDKTGLLSTNQPINTFKAEIFISPKTN